MPIHVRVEGLEEVRARFNNPQALRKPMQNFFISAAKITQGHAQADAPQRTGKLKRSIAYRVYTRMKMYAKVYVNARASKTWPKNVPIWVEEGTKPHEIGPATSAVKGRTARRAARLSRLKGEKVTLHNKAILINGHPYALAHHPGTRPHPFMAPAAQQSQAGIMGLASRLIADIKAELSR
jgi:hypothetical protein